MFSWTVSRMSVSGLCDGYDAEGRSLHHDFWIDGMFPLRFMETLGDELCKIYIGALLSLLAWVRLDVAQGGEIRRS